MNIKKLFPPLHQGRQIMALTNTPGVIQGSEILIETLIG
jgi:hypothetical protein